MRTVRELSSPRDRTAIVTGGSRGLGLQMAAAPGEQGARVRLAARDIEAVDLSDTSAVALFASDAGKHITGRVLAVDGGVAAV